MDRAYTYNMYVIQYMVILYMHIYYISVWGKLVFLRYQPQIWNTTCLDLWL